MKTGRAFIHRPPNVTANPRVIFFGNLGNTFFPAFRALKLSRPSVSSCHPINMARALEDFHISQQGKISD
jgi:hypothetical protein